MQSDIQFGPISFLPGPRSGKYPHCHSVFVNGARKILIDPASDRERLERLRDNPGVDAVVLTHYHEDHMMHLDLFEDAELMIHELDAPALADLEVFLDCYGMEPGPVRDFWRVDMMEKFHYRPRQADRFLVDGDEIDLGGVTMKVLHTPGHTPGHLSLNFPEQGVLLLGDYDLTPFGPWYGDVGADIDRIVESVRRLQKVPVRTWLACHEKGVFDSAPANIWDDYLAVVDYREERLWRLLDRGPVTLRDVIEERIVYQKKREPAEFYDLGESCIMGKHLERLVRQGRVVREGDVYRPIRTE